MEPRTLQFICDATGGTLSGLIPTVLITGVCTDSRQIKPGDLFFALKGERFDGHRFLDEVFAKGAAAAVVETAPGNPEGRPLMIVPDVRAALGKLAARYRQDFALRTVAVGGSNGKTSTKELVAAVLSAKFKTLWSEGSFNNDIGVPLTLLRLESGHQAGVFEVGTNHPGELGPLAQMIRPEFGVITSIGREHLEFFGDLAGVAEEEGALAEFLLEQGKLFVNGDSPGLEEIARRTRAGITRLGCGAGNDWRVENWRVDENGTRFNLAGPDSNFSGEYQTNLLGRHQAVNAGFAILLGRELGLNRQEIESGLAGAQGAKMRLQARRADHFMILDDCYNANADSMAAALETLRVFPCQGKRMAILGEMGELGEASDSAHREVGEKAADAGIEALFAVGSRSAMMAGGARQGGMRRVFEAADSGAAVEMAGPLIEAGDVVLVKASRSSRFERIVEALGRLPAEAVVH